MTFDLRRYIALAACSLVAFAAQLADAQTPTVSGVSISSTPASGDTYQLAEVIEVRITFDRNVAVSGEPLLALTIGSTTRYAGLSESREAVIRRDETVVIFAYVVQSSDSDVDGISIGSSALSLNGGTISNLDDDTSASLNLGSRAISNSANHKVDGSIDTTPTVSQVHIYESSSGDTFELAEEISVDVTFDRAVDVTGTPGLTLGIGSTTRQASVNQNLLGDRLVNTLNFNYVVQSSDSDADGISIGSSALSLSGGTLRIRGGTSGASLSLGSHAISNSSNHKVDGSIETAPEAFIVFTSPGPARDDTYERGEAIVVWMFFTRRVDVSGEPQMVLTIGSTTRYATYLGIDSNNWLRFRYVVQSSDRDADGFNTSALILNGGTIRIRGGTTNALLDLGQRRTSLARYKVDGSRGTSSAPTEVRTEAIATGLLVTWSAATGATSYKVQWRLAGEAWSSFRQEETTATRLELYGLAPGSYEVRVVAVVDGQDGAASGTTAGEVAAPVNAAPRRAEELPALALDVGETKTVDLDSAFEDPNDDLLRYSASSDNEAVSVQVASGEARIRGVRPGEATITVVATDPEGLSATTTFKVEVGALLSLSGSAAAPEGGKIVFTVTLSRALAEPFDFVWRTAPDGDASTADADASDYESAGMATIPAGQTTGTIEIAIVDDDDIEPAREHFVVELEEPEDANVGLSRRTRAMAMIQEGVCDRTPAVRDELTRNWQGCHLPKPLGLARVPALNLAGRGIEALRPNDLLGLRGLLRLDLRGNALAALPPALLAATPRLRTLDLSANALEALPDGLFAGVEGLREVAVEGNPGAPFRLAVELVRTDAEPWAPGPATVSARAAIGAPFAMVAPLVVAPAADESAVPPTVEIAAGETTGTSFAAASVGGASLALRPDAVPMPTTQCGGLPCFRGFEATAGSALILFHRPPQALAAPTLQPLAGDDALRVPLDSLIVAGDAPDSMRWEASSSDESLATVRIVGTDLVVEPEPASEGRVEIALVATDALGFATTVRFEVQVEFHWPIGPARGWRSIFGGTTPDAAATTQ